jgi:decaprenylphospho-beta-D-ribofuranose 2-oxidase
VPVLNRLASRAFNELWFRKSPRHRAQDLQTIEAFFYPLDGVDRWNTVYGRRGFLQWQCVIPFGEETCLRRIIQTILDGPVAATLAVLKRFGASGPAPLSFPLPGWTLAVDFPAVRGAALAAHLDALDREVVEAGGRLYLAKDSRMRPDLLPVMYLRLAEWRAVQAAADPAGRMTSDLDRRLGVTAHAAEAMRKELS